MKLTVEAKVGVLCNDCHAHLKVSGITNYSDGSIYINVKPCLCVKELQKKTIEELINEHPVKSYY